MEAFRSPERQENSFSCRALSIAEERSGPETPFVFPLPNLLSAAPADSFTPAARGGGRLTDFPVDAETFSFLREVVHGHSGILLTEKEAGMLKTRVGRRLRELGLSSFSQYVQLLLGPGAAREVPALLDAVTVNYTFFFRERRHFEVLGSTIFSRFLSERGRRTGALRGWSAGCSSGQEPYSIAMAFAEVARNVEGQDFRLLATDVSQRVVRAGAAGIYPVSLLSGIPQEIRAKYLTRDGATPPHCLRIALELRNLVAFRRVNMLRDAEAFREDFDFIFCRNVMIYFDADTRVGLLAKFHGALNPGGLLFVGSNETLSDVSHGFRRLEPGVFRKD